MEIGLIVLFIGSFLQIRMLQLRGLSLLVRYDFWIGL